MKLYRYFLIVLAVVVLDQTVKLWVYFDLAQNHVQEINVIGEWFKIHYLLNPGMAFGLKWDATYGKMLLTLFRIIAAFGIGYYLVHLFKKGVTSGLLICMSLVLAGAIGNVIDSTFYGVLLDNAPYNAPTPWFNGQVIDMFFFPLLEGTYPGWMPLIGGDNFLFFSYVFNVADSSVFLGVVFMLIFQKKFFKSENKDDAPVKEEQVSEATI
ncbi:MAG: lipoprotein signal peptidase [Bacteroidota bacterium]